MKGFIPVMIAISLIRFEGMKSPLILTALLPHAQEFPMLTAQLFQILTALFAVLGHNYSPWVGFKGGKGIATSAGVLLALMPAGVILLAVVWLAVFLTTRYVSVASIVAAAALPLITIYGSWYHGKIADGTWNIPLFAFSVLIAVLAIWKHRSNIQRLRAGTEHRFTRKEKPANV